MKLHELEDEINSYKRIAHKRWIETGSFLIKSQLEQHPLYFCSLESKVIEPYTPAVDDLFDDVWEVL